MTSTQYKKWYYRNHRAYERTAYSIIRKRLKAMLVAFANENPTDKNWQLVLSRTITEQKMFDAINELYLTIGTAHGKRMYDGIKDNRLNVKAKWPSMFSQWFADILLNWLRLHAFKNIRTMTQTFIDEVKEFIISEREQNKNITPISKAMVRNFGKKTGLYRWQMMRIVRTETASSANFGAWQAMIQQDILVDKMWISARDHRVRDGLSKGEYDHVAMNNKTIPLMDYFKVENREGQINEILYPVDMQNGVAGNIINCRCTIAPKPRRDKDGFVILKSEHPELESKAGFDPNQTRDLLGRWSKVGGGSCHEKPKKFDKYMDYEGQVKKILEYTTYGSENQYKKSRWVDWFLGERQENKNPIAYDIHNDPELERALKSTLYKFWKEEGTATDEEKKMSFKDFQNHTIKLYRGVSHKNIKDQTIHQNGFTSYALMRGLAERWSADGDVREYNIKVSNLFGAVNIVGGEIEVLEPQPYSEEFANQIFNTLHNDLFETDFIDDPKGYAEYRKIKESRGSACALMYAKNYLSKHK